MFGTDWIAMVTSGEALLIDRTTGLVDEKLPLPVFPEITVGRPDGEPFTVRAGNAWVAASGEGVLFTGVNRHSLSPMGDGSVTIDEMGAELTANSVPVLSTPLWSVDFNQPQFSSLAAPQWAITARRSPSTSPLARGCGRRTSLTGRPIQRAIPVRRRDRC